MHKLFLIWSMLLRTQRLTVADAQDVFADVITVAAEEEPLYEGPTGRAQTAALLLVWVAGESAGVRTAIGKAGDCGRLQTLYPASRVDEEGTMHSCEELKSSHGTLDIRLGLSWMRKMRDVCGGSVRRGLVAYASGKCQGKSEALVDMRLGWITSAITTL